MTDWLIDDSVDSARIAPALAAAQVATRGTGDAEGSNAALVVRLHDLIVHNNRKWITFLGGADVRVDLVVVQGNVLEHDPTTCYTPTTLRFESVGDGDSLPVDEQGILAYYGWPKHFLDISVIVSRDTAHSDDLSALLSRSAANPEVKTALSALIGVAVAVPPAAAVAAALDGSGDDRQCRLSGRPIDLQQEHRLVSRQPARHFPTASESVAIRGTVRTDSRTCRSGTR